MLSPDPGPLPHLPAPLPGEQICLRVRGLPPYKDISFSIRNPRHRHHQRFVDLRQAATRAMGGRAWYTGSVGLKLNIHAPILDRNRKWADYLGGVADTLDGSHGFSFTYLPIVYQDDCQFAMISGRFVEGSTEAWYEAIFDFLDDDAVVRSLSEHDHQIVDQLLNEERESTARIGAKKKQQRRRRRRVG
jgi:hypothetical protein